MAELAEELTLLLLSADEWRTLGYLHRDASRGAICVAFLAEPWVNGGPPPTLEELRRELPKQSSAAPQRALDPLVASGRVERERSQSRLGRIFSAGQAKNWRVVDRAGRQAVFDRVAASLGGTKPPPLRDAALGRDLVRVEGVGSDRAGWARATASSDRRLRTPAVGAARSQRSAAGRRNGAPRRRDRPRRAALDRARVAARGSRHAHAVALVSARWPAITTPGGRGS